MTGVSTSQSTGSYKAGVVIPISVTFSSSVDVTGTPQLQLNDAASADYVSGSGTDSLLFDYTVTSWGQRLALWTTGATDALVLDGRDDHRLGSQ